MHTLSIIAFCWFAAQSIVGVINGVPVAQLGEPIVATAISIIARAMTQALLDALAVRGAAIVKSQLRGHVIDAVDVGGQELLGTTSSSRLVTLLGQGLDALDGYIGRYLPQLILTAVATPLVVTALLLADLVTGITVILTLPLIPVFMALIGMATQAVQRRQWQQLGALSQGFMEVVQGLSTLMVFGRQHRQADRIAQVTEQYRRRTMTVLRLSFLSGFTLELAASLSVALVAVSVGVRLIDGDIGLALGLFVLILVPEAYLPLRQVGVQFHAASEGIAAADDVLGLLDTPAAQQTGTPTLASQHVGTGSGDDVARPGHAAERSGRAVTTPVATLPVDALPALAIRDLTVRRGDRVVIDRLSGEWMPGTVLAITGPSGAGKSSLLGVVLGLVDAEGDIELDGAIVAAADRASRIAWSGQRPDLTGGTLDAVVSLGSATTDSRLVSRSLQWAAVDDVPRDTELGAAGEGLSGGQAQRIALARAYYRAVEHDCRIVLLDEPTSALDATTESRVVASVRALADEGRLVVIVTHRRAVMAAADAVLAIAGPLDQPSPPLAESHHAAEVER